jgi:hypothetical protein
VLAAGDREINTSDLKDFVLSFDFEHHPGWDFVVIGDHDIGRIKSYEPCDTR